MTDDLPVGEPRLSRQSVAPGTSALPAELWQAVLDAWDEPKRHEALLLHCQSAAQLAAAASNYRSVLDDPERREFAEVQLKRIAAAAMAQMAVNRATETPVPRSKLAWQLLLLLVFAVGAVLLLRLLNLS